MKKVLCFIVLSLALGVATVAQAAGKPRIGVMRFTNNTNAGWWHGGVGSDLQDMLISELADTKAFSVLERKELDRVIGELRLGESGLVDESTKSKLGRLKGAKYLVAATVSAFEEQTSGTGGGISAFGFTVGGKKEKAYLAVDLKLIDVETGEIADSRTVEATASSGGANISGGIGFVGGELSKYEKTPTGKAIRACIIEMSEYLECSLTKDDGDECRQKYAAKNVKRKEKTKKAVELDE
jgi:curli biogenesis system outer membrane secretion channel CsgG